MCDNKEMNRTITLIETISGFQTGDRVEFLNYQAEGKSINLVAYIKKGNDSIKVFTYQSFTEYFVLNQKDAIHQNINLNTYFSSLLLERYIKHHYFGMPLPKEELMFAFLGNGVSVCDRLRKEHGDYMEIAHIAVNREITFYNPVSDEGRTRIEKFAKEENITIKSQGISALCPAINNQERNEDIRRSLSKGNKRKRM